MRHFTIYSNPGSYCIAPDLIRLRNGDLLVSFREATGKSVQIAQEKNGTTVAHLDPEAGDVLVRSTDGGETWDETPTLVYDDPRHCEEDVPLIELSDGTLLAAFFAWHIVPIAEKDRLGIVHLELPQLGRSAEHLGVFVVRSRDQGHTWEKKSTRLALPTIETDESRTSVHHQMLELPDGTVLAPITMGYPSRIFRCFIARSRDKGRTWGDVSLVAEDPNSGVSVSQNETGRSFLEPGLLLLDDGKMLAMMRSSAGTTQWTSDYLYQCVSYDWGHTWTRPEPTPMWGSPAHLLRLENGHVLCTYGHRRAPFGVRACFSYDEGETWDIEHEVVPRDDGISGDLGYPVSLQLEDQRILSVYWIHETDPPYTRYVAGTF